MPANPQSDGKSASNSDSAAEKVQFTVESEEDNSKRLDLFLSERIQSISRVKIRRAITAGDVLVDGDRAKPSYKLKLGQKVSIVVPEVELDLPEPENIPLDILFEDEFMVAVNKPPFMVVHPSKGHWSGTLTAALAFHFQQLSSVGGATRPGIVHRLDRDTSGVILIAKTDEVHLNLAAQFEQRTIQKEYFAIVTPPPELDRDIVNKPIGPHPYQREKMAIREDHASARNAESFYEVTRRFKGFASILVKPKTGRTHQIRVHMAHIGYPVLADKLYSGRSQLTLKMLDRKSQSDEVILNRQALHAQRITFVHPKTNEETTIEAPLRADLQTCVDRLEEHRG